MGFVKPLVYKSFSIRHLETEKSISQSKELSFGIHICENHKIFIREIHV